MNAKLISALTLVAVLVTNGITLAQPAAQNTSDSLLDRVKGTKHIGLRADDRLSGYVLYLYTKEQRAENLAALAEYRKELVTFTARIEALDAKRRSAQQRRAPVDELNSITRERSELRRPSSLFVRSRSGQSIIQLYDVVHVGDDYIELRGSENPGDASLVPLSRVCRVIMTSSDKPKSQGEPSDEPKSR